MGHVDVNRVSYDLPDGRPLLRDVSLRVGEGARIALIGPNGTGKTTLGRIISGDLAPHDGVVTRSGGLGVMRQFVGSLRDESTVRDLLVSVAHAAIRAAAAEIDRTELALMERDSEADQFAYAQALVEWGDAGGYDYETLWDTCTVAALGMPFERAQWRRVTTLSGGEQKRVVLEALLRGPDEVLLLDEPDNFLDVPAKRWLEDTLIESPKTVLFVSHDRELMARVATRVATLEPGRAGSTAVGASRAVRHVRRRRGSSATPASTSCGGAGTRSTPSSRTLVIMYRQKAVLQLRNGPPAAGGGDPAAQVPAGRATRGRPAAPSGCRCASPAGEPPSAPSSASSWS